MKNKLTTAQAIINNLLLLQQQGIGKPSLKNYTKLSNIAATLQNLNTKRANLNAVSNNVETRRKQRAEIIKAHKLGQAARWRAMASTSE